MKIMLVAALFSSLLLTSTAFADRFDKKQFKHPYKPMPHSQYHGRYHDSGWHKGWYKHDRHVSRDYYGSDRGYRGWGGYDYRPHEYKDRLTGSGSERIIWNGIRTGQLSRDEVRDLEEQRRDIQRKRSIYSSDGWLSDRERRDLWEERRDCQRALDHNLHDGEKRFW